MLGIRTRRGALCTCSTALALALLLAATSAARGEQQTGPKIYISADMEGLAGVVTDEQLGPTGFEYERFRRFMTEEVLAAIEGARAAGAGEILVSDSHGNGQNLLIEMIPDDVEVVRSWPRPLMMMEGIDDSFDGAIFIGYHAGTTNPDGVRAHTMSSARLADVRINGVSVPEAGINAAIAGHFGVPVIMLSGDDAIAAEARAIIGGIETAVVKQAISFHAARTLTPAAAQALIRDSAERAVLRIDEFRPYTPQTPITAEVRFKNYRPSQLLALLPMFERPDAHSVRFTGIDMLEVSRVFEFILDFGAVIEP
jgi:D-amino peptidase